MLALATADDALAPAMRALASLGVATTMLTGDAEGTAQAVRELIMEMQGLGKPKGDESKALILAKKKALKKGATELVKFIASRFDEMQLFVGEKMDYEGAFCFAYQKEQEDEGPTFLFFKDGLKENKY